nr:MAG TPA: hypothetical protein [Caudoviricetes sp.]
MLSDKIVSISCIVLSLVVFFSKKKLFHLVLLTRFLNMLNSISSSVTLALQK